MEQITLIVAIVFASISVTSLGCLWLSLSYCKKKRGLTKGASQRDIAALQQKVNDVQEEVGVLKKEVQRLIRIAKGNDE